MRIREEQLALVRHLADDARERGSPGSVQEWEQRSLSYQEGAEIIPRVIASSRRDRGGGPGIG